VLAIGGLLTRREVAKRDAKAVAHASMVEFRTEIGERRVVRLPDGSSVTLAPVSVLRAPATFAENGRAVELKGEAFFVVMPDSARPFTVESGRATVRVLGTSFNVRAYDQTDDHSEVSVVVVTGRVSLRDEASKQSVVATPGQAATLSAAGNLVVRDSVQVSDYTGWVNGRLVFRDRTLASVVSTLERWYGVDIQIQDSTLARERLTAVLTNQSLNEALDALAATVGASYERHDHLILLRK
jgi:ferric-dicitrate binding protein FerR (iron transport regulator)